MTVSHWRRTHDLGDIRCDVLVVGAGVCGLSAALHIQRRGLRVAVVERYGLASGASSRNAGFLMRGAAENYYLATQIYGREQARMVWRWTEENLAGLRAEGVESLPSCKRVPSVLLALEERELEELRRSEAMLREDGFEVGWMEAGDDAAWSAGVNGRARRPLGGLVNPNDASCNPFHIMRHLASRLQTPVLLGQEVFEIDDGGPSCIRVRTSDARIECGSVLLCTNAYAPFLAPSLAGIVKPRRGQMLAIADPRLRVDNSYYANHGYEYFRQAWDGTIVVGGCRKDFAELEVGYDDTTTPYVQEALERFACGVFGLERAEMNITGRWSGTMGFSPDGLPLIGPVRREWPSGRVWFCGGFTGHGMSMAHRTSLAAVDSMLDGAPNPLSLERVRKGANSLGSRRDEEERS